MCRVVLAAIGVTCGGAVGRADVGVMLADPTGIGASVFTHAGHALVYLSDICPVSPVQARLCRKGEQGSVVTTYPNFGEAQEYAWNLIPLSLYLQGTMTPENRLLYGSTQVKSALEAHARDGYLREVCRKEACPQVAHSYWRDVIGASLARDIFVYAVHTTPEQDQMAVEWLNSSVNVNHYNGMTNNCAVFTRALVNLYFPHSVHRDFPNDLGMMAPKAAARSFTHWAVKHPDLGFYTLHFAQVPGSIPRSKLAQSGTETAIHMKWYLIPAAMIGDHEVAGSFFVSYFLTGRFGLYKEYAHYSDPSIVELETKEKESNSMEGRHLLEQTIVEKSQIAVGRSDDWDAYKARFETLKKEPGVRDLTGSTGPFPKEYDHAQATVDANGNVWMSMEKDGSIRRVGVSTECVLADGSDPELGFQLMLGRVEYALRAKNHARETIAEFRRDWSLMEQTRTRLITARSWQIRVADVAHY